MRNNEKIPQLGDIVKVYNGDVKDPRGGFIDNSEYGIVVKVQPGRNGIVFLKQSFEKYDLHLVNWFLEANRVRFV